MNQPPSWTQSEDGIFCLSCSRAMAGDAALDAAPAESTHEERSRIRRRALVEFEIERDPDGSDRAIAQACRTSKAAVTAIRNSTRLDGAAAMEIGLGLAALVALMTNLASLLKHRGCQQADPVRMSRPMASIRGLATSRWFAAGWALAALAWLVHVAALSLAPISLVQAVLAGGAVTLAVMSQRFFGGRVERRQWSPCCSAAAASCCWC